MKFERVQPGMVLLDIHKQRMGNTAMRHWVCYRVCVVSVDREARTAMCSWNGNSPTRYYARDIERLKTKETKAYREQVERRKNGGIL